MHVMKQGKTVNERIDEVMLKRNMTNQELAAKISRHVTTVDRILSGSTTPSFATVKAIADALDCPSEYLIKGTGPDSLKKEDAQDPYRDYAIQRLEKEAETWQKKYEQVWDKFTNLLERIPMGKLKPDNNTALYRKSA